MKLLPSTVLVSLSMFNQHAFAQDAFQASGPSLTKGVNISSHDSSASIHNPASPSFLMNGNEGFQSNFLSPIGLAYEVGKIDSLIDELDELIDILEDENLSASEALNAKDKFEPFLVNAARNGMIKMAGNASVPFFPMFYHTGKIGTFSADLRVFGSFKSIVMDDKVDIVGTNNSFSIDTSAAVYLKSSGIVSLGVGYSRPVWKSSGGLLHAGIRANINQFTLAKNVIALKGLEEGEDIADAIQDDYEDNETSTTSVGLDIGLMWESQYLHAGFSIKDINQPEYNYGNFSAEVSDCNSLSGISVENCLVAQSLIADGRINANDVYVAKAQANLSATTYVDTKIARFGFHSSVDLNDKNDAFGDAYQWANIATSAQFDNWLIPEFRVGYTKNLAGTKLSYYSVGITFLKQADLDIRWSDESVVIDESKTPRSAYFSFAIQTKF